MRIYILGAMRGVPFYNIPAFNEAQEQLEILGHEVVNPAQVAIEQGLDWQNPDQDWSEIPPGMSKKELAAECAKQLLSCEAVHCLGDFWASIGARAEYALSQFAGMPTVDRDAKPIDLVIPVTEEATFLTHRSRIGDYGHPKDDFARTAKMWEMVLGIEIEPYQVGLCMMAVKFSRACNKPKRDNLADFAGYAETVARVLEDR